MGLDRVIAECLPKRANRPEVFGEQHLLDPMGEIVGEDPRLLMSAVDLSLDAVAGLIRRYGGLAVPAHIDRRANGLLPVLGFIPPGLRADLWELSSHLRPDAACETWPELATRALVNGSDAHYLEGVGCSPTRISRDTAEARLEPAQWGRALAQELLGPSG
jgi:hypothetical protein